MQKIEAFNDMIDKINDTIESMSNEYKVLPDDDGQSLNRRVSCKTLYLCRHKNNGESLTMRLQPTSQGAREKIQWRFL